MTKFSPGQAQEAGSSRHFVCQKSERGEPLKPLRPRHFGAAGHDCHRDRQLEQDCDLWESSLEGSAMFTLDGRADTQGRVGKLEVSIKIAVRLQTYTRDWLVMGWLETALLSLEL